MRFVSKPSALAMAIAGVLATSQGHAIELEEVVVTAQKRQQSANDVGMAINAFSGDTMKELGVQDSRDMAAVTPGLTFTDTGGGPPVYTLRGVGFNDVSYNATSTVGVYVDEAGLSFPIMTLGALLDVERVEVLKGPQGTLYGRNNTGGALNYIANKPTEEFGAGFTSSFSSFDTIDFEGYVNGSLSDTVRARLALKTTQSDEGWQENTLNNDKLGEKDMTSLRFSLAADLSDTVDGLLQLSWWENQSDTQAPQFVRSAFQNPGNATAVGIIGPLQQASLPNGDNPELAGWTIGQDLEYDLEFYSIVARLNVEINDSLQFTSLTQYARLEDDGSRFERSGFTGIPYAQAQPFLSIADTLGLNGGNPIVYSSAAETPFVPDNIFSNQATIETVSQELRLTYETDIMTLIGGLYYAKDEADTFVRQEPVFTTNSNLLFGVPTWNVFGADTIAIQETDIYGIFLHSEWQLQDNLRLTAGARYSEDKTDFTGCTADQRGDFANFYDQAPIPFPAFGIGDCFTQVSPALDLGAVNSSLNEESTSWRLGLDWFVNDDIMVYTSYSRGFKAGTFPNLAASAAIQYVPAKQEQLDAYEIGMKATLLDGTMQLNASAFYYDYSDKQVLSTATVPIWGALRRLVNVPESEVTGVEVDMQWQPMEGLFISLAVSNIDTEIDEFTGTDALGNQNVVFDGSEFPFTANFQFNAIVNYNWSINDDMEAFVGVDGTYTSDINTDLVPDNSSLDDDFVIDGYGLLNARIGVADIEGRWRAFVWSRNLTDEFYVNNVQKSTDQVVSFAGMPQTYGVTVEYNFF